MEAIIEVIVLKLLLFFSDYSNAVRSSFEGSSFTRIQRQIGIDQCILPVYPENGHWKLLKGEGEPGDPVPISSVITFECNHGYKLSSETTFSVCFGKWSLSQIPECEKLCPPQYSTDTYKVKCIHKLGREINCTDATHGSILDYSCSSFYETPFGYQTTILCEEGEWSSPKPVCQPVCGKKIDNDKAPVIYGGKLEDQIVYPWVAAIFRLKDQTYNNICGGSILSPTIVLTAAHCVTNTFGDALPKENYIVGAGKLYREYQAPQDEHAQYLELFKIIVHEDYKADIRLFFADIAVLVVNDEFVLTYVVQPVCFINMKNFHLHAGHKGEVAGWGVAENGLPSERLKTLIIPYKYDTLCADELPPNFSERYNLQDKICAGFINKSLSVCKGDSGSGFVFKNKDTGRYYVHGIVSLTPTEEFMCNIQQNSLYTKVSFYYDFIERLLNKYAPKIKDCLLPSYPQNGTWTVGKSNKKPGDAVPSGTLLTIRCDDGFLLSSSNSKIECGMTHNMPTCERLCPSLNFSTEIVHYCTDRDGQIIDCSSAIDGTKLWYFCPSKFAVPQGTTNKRTCIMGSWGSPKPQCILKECGRIADNVFEDGFGYPWHVGVYKMTNQTEVKYEYVCSGTLISDKIIVTSTLCVTNEETYTIAAATVYASFNDSRETRAQYSEVSEIVTNPLKDPFKSPDIAFLITEPPFALNKFIQPICTTDRNDVHWNYSDLGTLARWSVIPDKVEFVQISQLTFEECIKFINYSETFVLSGNCAKARHTSGELACLYRNDSGSGIVQPNAYDERSYLTGIASIYPGNENCIGYLWYTQVQWYFEVIHYMLNNF